MSAVEKPSSQTARQSKPATAMSLRHIDLAMMSAVAMQQTCCQGMAFILWLSSNKLRRFHMKLVVMRFRCAFEANRIECALDAH